MRYLWTTITVKDMDISLRFYQNILNLGVERQFSPTPEMSLAFLGQGETQIELIYNANAPEPSHSKDISIGFEVDSVNEMMEFVKTKGIDIYDGPYQPNPFIKFFYILDPNGVKIQLVENIK